MLTFREVLIAVEKKGFSEGAKCPCGEFLEEDKNAYARRMTGLTKFAI